MTRLAENLMVGILLLLGWVPARVCISMELW